MARFTARYVKRSTASTQTCNQSSRSKVATKNTSKNLLQKDFARRILPASATKHGKKGKIMAHGSLRQLRYAVAQAKAENAALAAKAPVKPRRQYNSRVCTRVARSISVAQPTLVGKGSVAHTGSVPEQYSVNSCKEGGEHKLVGNTTVRISDGYMKGYHIGRLGVEIMWCKECSAWISTEKLWYPKPSDPKPGMVYHESTISGNAMRSPIGNWHDPKLT